VKGELEMPRESKNKRFLEILEEVFNDCPDYIFMECDCSDCVECGKAVFYAKEKYIDERKQEEEMYDAAVHYYMTGEDIFKKKEES
jgi:hypothetical protein